MKKILSLFIIIIALLVSLFSLTACSKSYKKFTDYSFDYFDTATTIIGFETKEKDFKENCEKIKSWLLEYHRLYDIYTAYDGINNLCSVNESSGNKIKVDQKIIELLAYSKEMYKLTNGKLNVAMGSVLSFWHDYREYGLKNPQAAMLPPLDFLKSAANSTDIANVVLHPEQSSVLITDSRVKLDVGGIAKGFAAEEIAKKMLEEGISGYLLNIGGNVKIVGKKPGGEKWQVGIENPNTEDEQNPFVEQLSLENMSLVTSGSYQRFYTVGDKNYHHIIDPKTLFPAQYFDSVSVLCENSALADGLSTALFCMTYEEGKKLAEDIDGVYVMWVTPEGEKLYSKGFKDFCTEQEE